MSAAKKLDKNLISYKAKFEALEKELQELRSAPKDHQSMVEISQAIAHEINTPLSVILMKAEISLSKLNQDMPDLEKVKGNLEKITKTVNKISSIIKSLQSYSQMNFTQPFLPIDVREILISAKEYIDEFLIIEGLKIQTISPEQSHILFCRAGEIGQVITNLVKNSIDAIADLNEKWIHLEAEEDNGFILIKITDSGNGITKENSENIFKPFYTDKKLQKGMGIGLSLSRTIIEAHGGEIYINDQHPNTQFVIKLLKNPQNTYHKEDKA